MRMIVEVVGVGSRDRRVQGTMRRKDVSIASRGWDGTEGPYGLLLGQIARSTKDHNGCVLLELHRAVEMYLSARSSRFLGALFAVLCSFAPRQGFGAGDDGGA
jgi:hypothetical protein